MRLGFYYHIPAVNQAGMILMPGYLGRFLDSLASHFDSLLLFQHEPNTDENVNLDYSILSNKAKLISLPPRGSVPKRILNSRRYTKIIREHLSEIDAILLRGPTPLLPFIGDSIDDKPRILLIIGDQLAGVDSLPQPLWRKELIRFWAWHNAKQQLRVAQNSLVFVNSRVLFRQFDGKVNELVETRTSTLNSSDFFVREDTCSCNPIRLLYTGRMDPSKGLMDIVNALGILVTQGEDVVLDLVGWPEKKSNILLEIAKVAQERNLTNRIFYHGYKPVGPELFAFYKNADVYVIASQTSEGFPRTIWEAMAHSLPVVATKVGSIPDFISDAAELVDPQNPVTLATGISKVIHNANLRRHYVKNGLELAHYNSLENQVGAMAEEISKWIEGKKNA